MVSVTPDMAHSTRPLRCAIPAALVAVVASGIATSPVLAAAAANETQNLRAPAAPPTSEVPVDEAIDGMTRFVMATVGPNELDERAVMLDECPLVPDDELIGMVPEQASAGDDSGVAPSASREPSTTTDDGEFLTLTCFATVGRDGKLVATATLTVLLYPEAPTLETTITAADPERELQRFDELGTIGYCDTPTGWPTCAQFWQQGRLVVVLARGAAEPTPDLNSASTADALADLVPTVLDNLANLTPAES